MEFYWVYHRSWRAESLHGLGGKSTCFAMHGAGRILSVLDWRLMIPRVFGAGVETSNRPPGPSSGHLGI